MSAFKVNSSAIREFADSTLDVAYDDTSDAKTYIESYGDFSFNQTGAIGCIAGTHHDLMSRLESMLGQFRTSWSGRRKPCCKPRQPTTAPTSGRRRQWTPPTRRCRGQR
jgi:hypothetical protein